MHGRENKQYTARQDRQDKSEGNHSMTDVGCYEMTRSNQANADAKHKRQYTLIHTYPELTNFNSNHP